ncbi:glycosyltransferase family 87 protein [Hyphococcus luteus]|uniref:DUF2029 domain-containing protein n=1 Tax=Hyphococcus luteus TaxID=2058213 RepID=A0A2S7K6L9_9PROT|nr:glycosyltransferase family 87 protein [Marinicaulis flavus]PQA88129.1 hypothetical protein CW354_07365 [Marinicaulis flavus]
MNLAVFNRADGAADIRLTALQAKVGAIAVILPLLAVGIAQIVLAKNYITPAGPPLGGDFITFWTAAKAAVAGQATTIYDVETFREWLARLAPGGEGTRFTWQYPPTYFLIIGLLAFLPYGLAYAVWTGGGFACFAAATRAAGLRGLALFLVIAAPATFQAVITGQNGFLTATLLLGATLMPDKRPLLAGACAAALTVKPQLGLLIPIAYAAGGHWRAFGYAAGGAVVFAGASVAAFGVEAWTAFFASIMTAGGNIASGVMPLFKMPTVFAALSLAGVPAPIALAFHLLGAGAAMWATWRVWRESDNRALKAAVVCAGAFLVAPYAYYYELVIMAAPIALLAVEASREGWRRYDHLLLAGLFLVPMILPGTPTQDGFNLAFVATVLAFIFVLRRMQPQSLTA